MRRSFLPALSRGFDVEVKSEADATRRASTSVGRAYGFPSQSQTNVERIVKEGWERVVWVFKAVDTIADTAASLPIIEREGDPDTGEKVETFADLMHVLNRKANIFENAYELRYRISALLLLSPRGVFVEKVRESDGTLRSLYLLPTDMTRPVPDPRRFVSEYHIGQGTNIERVKAEDVLWLRKPHPTDPYASATPMVSAGLSADMDFAARLFNRNFLANDGRPGGIVAVKGPLQPEDAEELKARHNRGGPANAGKTSVIEADGVEYIDTAMSPRDLQWVQALKGSKEEILAAFGAPESVIGNASGRTFANADAEWRNFWKTTMLSHLRLLNSNYDQLTPEGTADDHFIVHDTSGVEELQREAEKREREQHAMSELNAGSITPDEYREIVGREPFDRPASRALWLPSSKLPVGRDDEDDAVLNPQAAAPAEPGDQAAPPEGTPPADQSFSEADVPLVTPESYVVEDATAVGMNGAPYEVEDATAIQMQPGQEYVVSTNGNGVESKVACNCGAAHRGGRHYSWCRSAIASGASSWALSVGVKHLPGRHDQSAHAGSRVGRAASAVASATQAAAGAAGGAGGTRGPIKKRRKYHRGADPKRVAARAANPSPKPTRPIRGGMDNAIREVARRMKMIDGDPRIKDREYDALVKDRMTRIDEIKAERGDTETEFDKIPDQPGGYAPERTAQHMEIVDSFLNKETAKTEGKALMLGGLPGAGKSTFLNSEQGQKAAGINLDDYVVVNPDDIKDAMFERNMVPEYEGLSQGEAALLLHEESSTISKILGEEALRQGKNVVFDKTLGNAGQAEKIMRDIAESGQEYETSVIFIDVPPALSMQRAAQRHQGGGRLVPYEYIAAHALPEGHESGFFSQNRLAFEETKQLFNKSMVVDNRRGGGGRIVSKEGF